MSSSNVMVAPNNEAAEESKNRHQSRAQEYAQVPLGREGGKLGGG